MGLEIETELRFVLPVCLTAFKRMSGGTFYNMASQPFKEWRQSDYYSQALWCVLLRCLSAYSQKQIKQSRILMAGSI